MNETTKPKTQPVIASEAEKKPGFFGRLFQKLDASMKQKAERQSEEGCCCGGSDDSKDDKCC